MKNRAVEYLLLCLSAFWIISIFWVNFHCYQWYQSDAYSAALLGRLIAESHSFFPKDWIFSNQYYLIGAPDLTALFYWLLHDTVRSMSAASCVNTLLIILSFYWCFRPYLEKKELLVGLLCISGGIIFGTSAIRYISGLQVLFTLASYYACYLIVILLTLGCWLRLRDGQTPWLMIILTVLLNYILGIHSLRALLVINIPLVLLECLFIIVPWLRTDGRIKVRTFGYAIILLLANLGGIAYIESLDIPATPIIEPVHLDLSGAGLVAHFWASLKNIIRISGIAIASDGLRYIPLSLCALLVAILVFWSLVHVIRTKDSSPLAQVILFSAIGVFGVFCVGVLLMRTRDIYYFVYWLLAAASIVYALRLFGRKYQLLLTLAVVAVSLINYGYNFIPDFIDYAKNHKKVEAFANHLASEGIRVIYVDASPIFAASSKDAILSQSFWLDTNCTDGIPLSIFPSDKYKVAFDDEHYEGALFCFSGYTLSFLNSDKAKTYRDTLMDQLSFYDEVTIGESRYLFYKPKDGKRLLKML